MAVVPWALPMRCSRISRIGKGRFFGTFSSHLYSTPMGQTTIRIDFGVSKNPQNQLLMQIGVPGYFLQNWPKRSFLPEKVPKRSRKGTFSGPFRSDKVPFRDLFGTFSRPYRTYFCLVPTAGLVTFSLLTLCCHPGSVFVCPRASPRGCMALSGVWLPSFFVAGHLPFLSLGAHVVLGFFQYRRGGACRHRFGCRS